MARHQCNTIFSRFSEFLIHFHGFSSFHNDCSIFHSLRFLAFSLFDILKFTDSQFISCCKLERQSFCFARHYIFDLEANCVSKISSSSRTNVIETTSRRQKSWESYFLTADKTSGGSENNSWLSVGLTA